MPPLRPWLELARVSNLPTVWTNVLAAWLISGGGWSDIRLLWLILGASLLYTAGMILNDAADSKWDRDHRPERPIPSGRVTLRAAWKAGLILLICGVGMMIGRGGADVSLTLILAAVILGYDFFHKAWAGSVILMGACRVLLYLAAASPLDSDPTSAWNGPVWIPALVLGAYVVGLSLVARVESKPVELEASGGGFAWLPILLVLTPALSCLYQARAMQAVTPIVIGLGLLVWISRSLRLMKTHPPHSIGPAVGRLLAGITWVDAAALSGSHPFVAVGFVLLVPLLMIWQRHVAAT